MADDATPEKLPNGKDEALDPSQLENSPLEIRLRPFLERNPESSIGTGRKRLAVLNPWGDATVAFEVESSDHKLIEPLNFRIPSPRTYSCMACGHRGP